MPPPKSGKDYNNSSRQSYECPPPPGPAQTLFAWVEPGRGGVARSATGGGANTRPLVIAKERETLKTLAYDCGNPVLICLRAFARSAFLFTGSPRSFHSLAMTKGTKYPNSALSYHPVTLTRATPPMEGNLARDDNITSSSSSGGVARYRAPRKCNFRGWLGRGGPPPVASAKGDTSNQ